MSAHIDRITKNKQAFRNYNVEDEYEAGVVLQGSEVKSLREGRVELKNSYATFHEEELWMVNAHIGQYQHGTHNNHRPERERKLLLHDHELDKLRAKTNQEGYTLVPLELYFKDSWVKVRLGVCKGKKRHDKRDDLKERQHEREVEREHARRTEDRYSYDS